MKKIIILTFINLMFLFTLSANASILNDFAFEELKGIELEMNYADFKIIHPEAKNIGDFSENFCILEHSNNSIWNGSILIFKNEKLKYLSVIRHKPDDEKNTEEYFNNEKITPILEKLTKILGKSIEKKINKKKDNFTVYYEPIITWKSNKNGVCLSYTPSQFINKVQNPSIILAVIAENENFMSYFQDLHDSPFDQVSFDDLLNESIKKILYGTNEVKIK